MPQSGCAKAASVNRHCVAGSSRREREGRCDLVGILKCFKRFTSAKRKESDKNGERTAISPAGMPSLFTKLFISAASQSSISGKNRCVACEIAGRGSTENVGGLSWDRRVVNCSSSSFSSVLVINE